MAQSEGDCKHEPLDCFKVPCVQVQVSELFLHTRSQVFLEDPGDHAPHHSSSQTSMDMNPELAHGAWQRGAAGCVASPDSTDQLRSWQAGLLLDRGTISGKRRKDVSDFTSEN